MTAVKLAGFFLFALICLAYAGKAHSSYVNCAACHLDPDPYSAAKDYTEYFVDRQRQHSVAVDYPPTSPEYRRPTAIDADITFFDTNGNGLVDLDEVQLFGVTDKVECSSCHREHGDGAPAVLPNMYLRIANIGSALCAICHKI